MAVVTDGWLVRRGIGWGWMWFGWALHVFKVKACTSESNVRGGGAGVNIAADCVDCGLHWDGMAVSASMSLLLLMAEGVDSGGSFWQYEFI